MARHTWIPEVHRKMAEMITAAFPDAKSEISEYQFYNLTFEFAPGLVYVHNGNTGNINGGFPEIDTEEIQGVIQSIRQKVDRIKEGLPFYLSSQRPPVIIKQKSASAIRAGDVILREELVYDGGGEPESATAYLFEVLSVKPYPNQSPDWYPEEDKQTWTSVSIVWRDIESGQVDIEDIFRDDELLSVVTMEAVR